MILGMIFESEPIVEVAKSLQCDPSQAILATTMFRGIEVIPRATKLERIILLSTQQYCSFWGPGFPYIPTLFDFSQICNKTSSLLSLCLK